MTAIRFNITGNALYEVVQILFGPSRNAARAFFINNSILRDKVFDASLIQPINQALVREELIRYIYELYFSNFGAPSQQMCPFKQITRSEALITTCKSWLTRTIAQSSLAFNSVIS